MQLHIWKWKLVFTVVSFFLAIGIGSAQKLEDLSWLAGDWISQSQEQIINESWSFMNDSTLVGSSITTKGDSVIFEEALKIEFRHDTIRYIAVLPFKIASFGLALRNESEYVFVDPSNDFPSKIIYRKTKPGLTIVLEGKDNESEMNFVRK